ncbi:MAG: hypothetical protein Q9210_003345 [Variospora velana]
MSYNDYNYSPYYQPTCNDGRGQNSYQNSASTNGRYQSSSYGASNSSNAQQQPSSAHSYLPQQPQPSYTPTTTAADRSAVSYSNYGDSPGTSQYQNVRGGYSYSDEPAGTTPLSNLAHASSLESSSRNGPGTRDNRSLQQIIDYNRAQNPHRNSASPLYQSGNPSVDYSQQRSESRGAASSGSYTADSAATDRRITTSSQYSQFATAPGYNAPTAAYTATTQDTGNPSYSSYQPNQEQRQSTYYAQPARPASGQSYHARDAQRNGRATQSPTVPLNPTPTATSTSYLEQKTPTTSYRSEQTSSHQRTVADRRRSPESPAQVTGNRSTLPPSTVTGTQRLIPPLTDTTNRQASRTPISPEEPTPTTVDPSHVFNHQEYQRRQAAAAEGVRAKKAAEAEEEIRKATEAAAALKRVSESHSAEPEQMAAEMRQMIEKMRDYKSKDPSLFSQIWEQVKKTQPAGSVPAAPPISAKDVLPTASKVNEISSPSPAPSRGIIGTIGGLPDLGKFPALRRKRGGKTDSPARRRKSGSKTEDIASPRVNGSQTGPPIDPAVIEASNQSLQQATQGAAANMTAATAPVTQSQVIYVSGTGPQGPGQVDANNAPRSSNSLLAPAPAPAPDPAPTTTPSTGKTAWPEHKKWDLAVAAKDILVAMPVNSAKANSISPEHILAYLNENPSYERLCQMIESKGLIIERSHFARCLLEEVPDMRDAHRPTSANAQVVTPKGAGVGPSKQLRYVSDKQSTLPTPPPNARTSSASTAQMTFSASQPPMTPQASATEQKLAVPLTKSEQARKRTVLELVDLSQLSDDDMPPPPKVQRLDDQSENPRPPPPNQPIDTLHGTLQPAGTFPPTSRPPFYPAPPSHSTHQAPPSPSAPAPPSAAPSSSASARQRELTNSEDIVKPIDERKARKRKRYDPKTIVRDVLLAAGRHPTMQPLNYHLDGLRKTFKHVNDVSDLSTFRWDLVDPGDPVPAPVAQEMQPKTNAGKDDAEDDADGNDGDDEEAVKSVAVNTPTAALPIVAQPPKLLGPHRKRQPKHEKVDSSWMSSGLPDKQSNGSAPTTPQAPGSAPSIEGSSTIKRRGRPPGTKNKHPRKSTGSLSQSTMASRTKIDTTPAQPSGLRNSVAGDGLAVVVPSPSPSLKDSQPKRGRPRKSSPKTSQQSRPMHRVYNCHWESCPAELHNLETLKKHVNKHSDKFKDGGPFPCLWRGCGVAARTVEGAAEVEMNIDAGRQPLQFGTHNIWAKHMDERHVSDYAWKVGDGPSIRSDSEVSDNVSESARRQNTPITANGGRPDPLPLTSDRHGAKESHKAHGNASELDKAKAFMEASEMRRESFGAGIDRTGATFVTKEKNALLDNSMGPLRKIPRMES